MPSIPNYKTVNQLLAEHSVLTPGSVRWDIFNADKNGLSKCGAIVRKGRRVYIDPEKYFSCMFKSEELGGDA